MAVVSVVTRYMAVVVINAIVKIPIEYVINADTPPQIY